MWAVDVHQFNCDRSLLTSFTDDQCKDVTKLSPLLLVREDCVVKVVRQVEAIPEATWCGLAEWRKEVFYERCALYCFAEWLPTNTFCKIRESIHNVWCNIRSIQTQMVAPALHVSRTFARPSRLLHAAISHYSLSLSDKIDKAWQETGIGYTMK